jgi:hypothetical protein
VAQYMLMQKSDDTSQKELEEIARLRAEREARRAGASTSE